MEDEYVVGLTQYGEAQNGVSASIAKAWVFHRKKRRMFNNIVHCEPCQMTRGVDTVLATVLRVCSECFDVYICMICFSGRFFYSYYRVLSVLTTHGKCIQLQGRQLLSCIYFSSCQ